MGATAGSEGTAVTALATMSNGAIVDSSGTYYVFAGGKAFGIPTPTKLAAIQLDDTATPLSGTITSTQTGATPRQGTVVTLNKRGVGCQWRCPLRLQGHGPAAEGRLRWHAFHRDPQHWWALCRYQLHRVLSNNKAYCGR